MSSSLETRRRTYFGGRSDIELQNITREHISIRNWLNRPINRGLKEEIELYESLSEAVEKSQAAGAELERRTRRSLWAEKHTRNGRLGSLRNGGLRSRNR